MSQFFHRRRFARLHLCPLERVAPSRESASETDDDILHASTLSSSANVPQNGREEPSGRDIEPHDDLQSVVMMECSNAAASANAGSEGNSEGDSGGGGGVGKAASAEETKTAMAMAAIMAAARHNHQVNHELTRSFQLHPNIFKVFLSVFQN